MSNKLCHKCNSANIETNFIDGSMEYFCKDCNSYNGSAHNYIYTGLKFRFGKHKGESIDTFEKIDYLKWLLDNNVYDKGYRIAITNRYFKLKHR